MSAPKKKKILTSKFDYHLPESLIAQKPAEPRDQARLLILDKITGKMEHRRFFQLEKQLNPGDVLVLNDSKVIPVRLFGYKETGGKVEIFLLTKFLPLAEGETKRGFAESVGNLPQPLLIKEGRTNVWQCLIGGKVKPGQKIIIYSPSLKKSDPVLNTVELKSMPPHCLNLPAGRQGKGVGGGLVAATIVKKLDDKTWLVAFNTTEKKLLSFGETPLPPYIKNQNIKKSATDYQTIYAKTAGSVAAPTAGLHFTKQLLNRLQKKGIQIEYITLHVGLGTFAPVKSDYIQDHPMHAELATIDKKTANRLNRAKKEGRRIIAVGTTSVRTLEAFSAKTGRLSCRNKIKAAVPSLQSKSDWINIFIYPGYSFNFVDAIITNFHLPKSTLLMLVSAFAGQREEALRRNVSTDAAKNYGTNLIKRAYAEAINKKYKFYSFGDAMFIT